jgi:hypothetical protein
MIDKAFNKLTNESFVCHWHKLEIIESYCDNLFGKIKQDFEYQTNIEGEKCQIENCKCNAEVKLKKLKTRNIASENEN